MKSGKEKNVLKKIILHYLFLQYSPLYQEAVSLLQCNHFDMRYEAVSIHSIEEVDVNNNKKKVKII